MHLPKKYLQGAAFGWESAGKSCSPRRTEGRSRIWGRELSSCRTVRETHRIKYGAIRLADISVHRPIARRPARYVRRWSWYIIILTANFICGTFGWGLKRNVLNLYKFICRNYKSEEDDIFAFGFSRGGFTIDVLIGLIARQGLVTFNTEAELTWKAEEAYRAYRLQRSLSITSLERLLYSLGRASISFEALSPGAIPIIARTTDGLSASGL